MGDREQNPNTSHNRTVCKPGTLVSWAQLFVTFIYEMPWIWQRGLELKGRAFGLGIICAAGLLIALPVQEAALNQRLVLWAWERHEDLSFLGRGEAAIAPVVVTVTLAGTTATTTWRRERMQFASGAEILPVIHVEAFDRLRSPVLNTEQKIVLTDTIIEVASRYPARVVQLDFEARPSQRAFYKAVLNDVRQRDTHIRLSLTALASWCVGDRWLQDLTVEEIVPMLFRMGRDGTRIRDGYQRTGSLPAKECNDSVGLATDEWMPTSVSARRIYLFSPRPWTRESFDAISKRVPS
ncbi:MAG: hypothetical protein IPG66_06285 [Hydrogenophilales bacterium]|nr:hypothetical protein [Hydrogenophilales bacterium]